MRSVQSSTDISLGVFLPADTSRYYRYEGSLTTPPYEENVSWVIYKEPLLLPKPELNELIKLFRHPARLPQGLNRRFLLANF
jgi:carbonic anhydrase